jgi:hypothetical protein
LLPESGRPHACVAAACNEHRRGESEAFRHWFGALGRKLTV